MRGNDKGLLGASCHQNEPGTIRERMRGNRERTESCSAQGSRTVGVGGANVGVGVFLFTLLHHESLKNFTKNLLCSCLNPSHVVSSCLMEKPLCRLCHARHLPSEPHRFESGSSAPKASAPAAPPISSISRSTQTVAMPSSVPTVARSGRPLDKDLDRSLARTKPWKAEGMSRATWYRRRKKRNPDS